MGSAGGPVPVVVLGLGVIGQHIVRAVQSSPEVRLLGAVDLSPQLAGRTLQEALDLAAPNIRISRTLAEAIGKERGVVVLQSTGSKLPEIADQLRECAELGASVVSTCEELAFPYVRHPDLAAKLEELAVKHQVCFLGTGVNPGFVLDRLVATAGQVCGPIRRVHAERIVDARTRREALQRKIGAGMTLEEFEELAEQDKIGHVGLLESAALCAVGLGIDCDDFEEELLPVIAEEEITGGAIIVPPGRVCGISQTAIGLQEGVERVRLELTIALGFPNPGDHIVIDADPPVELTISGGIAGDVATANVVVNAAPRVTAAEPGLLTVLELPAGR